MEPSSTDEYLTVAEIADLLKVNQQTVRNWIDDGALAAVRVGATLPSSLRLMVTAGRPRIVRPLSSLGTDRAVAPSR
jgi:excisionase family DNA binding protein